MTDRFSDEMVSSAFGEDATLNRLVVIGDSAKGTGPISAEEA